MRVGFRLIFALTLAASGTAVLWACSSDDSTIGNTPDGGSSSGTSGMSSSGSSGGGGEGGMDGSSGSSGTSGTSGTSGSSGPACPALDQDDAAAGPDAARIPEDYTNPKACHDCMATHCCTDVTNCYGGPAADGGYPGADGVKTNCMLHGECVQGCSDSELDSGLGDGGCETVTCIACSAACNQTYWGSTNDPPFTTDNAAACDETNCKTVCPQ